ncbi:MAG: class I SAM-dependent methyltransferase [Pseudomonadales bacterium]|nr:class I SAM-dependent methyltransferase [Pseudomonadales bacterium]
MIVAVLATGYGSIVDLFLGQMPSLLTGVLIFLSVLVTIFALSNRMFGWLLVLAIPLKLNHLVRNFEPKSSFTDIHQKIVDQHSERQRLKVLDVSTGTCNSLLRHGWINLDADYFGIDLSETMIIQGKMNCEKDGVEIKLALGDACDLPYEDTYFDLVLNYGAVNGYSDIEAAVSEMYRVLKPGGTMVIYDEQLYDERNFLEELYFSKVLSPHDMIHSCPTFAIPKGASYSVNQVYPYYYLCVVEKPG